ncbi:hypothetical protein ACMFMG_006245 [Clarireedia jacksonii]
MDFTIEFPCQGPKDRSRDDGLWQIWKIHNKYNAPPTAKNANAIVWEIQYWEDYPELGTNNKWYIRNEVMTNNYKDQLNEWNRLHATAWDEYYGGKNTWVTPERVTTPKRDFEDTPRKPRQSSLKKVRVGPHQKDVSKDYELMPPPARPGFGTKKSSTNRVDQPRPPKLSASHSKYGSTAKFGLPRSRPVARSVPPFITSPVSSVNDISPISSTDTPVPLTSVFEAMDIDGSEPANTPPSDPMDEDVEPRQARRQSPENSEDSVSEDEDVEMISVRRRKRIENLYDFDTGSEDDSEDEETDSEAEFVYGSQFSKLMNNVAAESQIDLEQFDGENAPDNSDDQQLDADAIEIAPEAPNKGPGGIHDLYARRLADAYSNGIYALVEAALSLEGLPCDNWVRNRKRSPDVNRFLLGLVFMTAGIDPDILKSLICGNIPKAEVNDPVLRQKFRMLKGPDKTRKRPFIYIHYLTDTRGNSPTPNQVVEILQAAQLYIQGLGNHKDLESRKLARSIDEAMPTDQVLNQGARRYVSGNSQRNTVEQWIRNTKKRMEFEIRRGKGDEALSHPISEVGYAGDLSRLDQHAKHQSSNYIMNLVESICRVKFSAKFKNRQYVIFNIKEACDAMFGEIMCTRYAQAYTSHGGGFSHYAAGRSIQSASKVPEEYYKGVQEELRNDEAFITRIQQEVEVIGRRNDVYERMFTSAEDQDGVLQRLNDSVREMTEEYQVYNEQGNRRDESSHEFLALEESLAALMEL